ncbi:MAG: hypothetical protein JO340_19030 [Acidobacteriaceae bacterium]|nr:hypothetical protein [Acidobacteriaceae bacterium]
MPAPQPLYRSFTPGLWLAAGRIRPWRGADHLLLVENRFFTEHYTRLFWNDIQAIFLYRLRAPNPILLALEVLCAVVVVSPVFIDNSAAAGRWPLIPGLAFLALYAAWRLPRPRWACEIRTRTNLKQFPLPGSADACRRVFEEIRNAVAQAQGALPEPGAESVAIPNSPAGSGLPREAVLIVHAIAFVLGILSPFSPILFGIYCAALIPAWFLQRDFRFPFAVRSAAVMSQLFAMLRIAAWIVIHLRPGPALVPLSFNDWRFGLPTLLFGIYGVAAVFWTSIQLARPREKTGATVLGLS